MSVSSAVSFLHKRKNRSGRLTETPGRVLFARIFVVFTSFRRWSLLFLMPRVVLVTNQLVFEVGKVLTMRQIKYIINLTCLKTGLGKKCSN